MRYRRVVAKCGTSLLTAGSDRLDLEAMSAIVGQVVRLRAAGHEVVVVSSGARAAGRHAIAHLPAKNRPPGKQALASIGQHRLMATWGMLFDAYDVVVAQVLLTRRDLSDRLAYLNARNTLRELMDHGVVPVVNENDVVALDAVLASKIGENDSLSAQVANLVEADLLVMLTDVDGLFDSDPRMNPEARPLARVERIDKAVEAMAGGTTGVGTGGMATKLRAALIATQGGADVVIANGRTTRTLEAVASGEARGTLVPAAGDRLESRKRWILGNLSRTGHVVVDAGAVTALRERGRSLLPAGVTGITGTFERGETVEVRDATGARIAAGQVNYASEDVSRIRGQRSDRIADVLGYAFGEEIIHRDNLVVL